ncbi:hypothetical protein Leryth_026409 [Lithospermum erythrorhizon]|nr:hypothetical protein Leryth_026409 [Lithospermum erythrorhizon]
MIVLPADQIKILMPFTEQQNHSLGVGIASRLFSLSSLTFSLNSRHRNAAASSLLHHRNAAVSNTTSASSASVSSSYSSMEIDHCVLGVVPSNSIDPTVTELVVKCQLAAIGGLEKQLETLKSKLKGCDEQANSASLFHCRSMEVILLISLSLVSLQSVLPSSVYVVILGVFIVAWAIASLIELLKLKTAHNLASIVRAQMDDLRASTVILQGVVEEDFRTNGLARCFMSYHSRLFRISMLVLRMGHYRGICTSIKLSGISVIVGSAYLGFLSVGMMRVLSC